ncbi:aldehyde dehydrogenase family protein [Roseomonas sp. CCTCC AB2023176]|uniref:aldehyde dehydrogenase family protein n=1 Tax=Roseomonas sp. CCTCC AB2023176 TaxID=3342640 RepID=UPI0035D7BDF8
MDGPAPPAHGAILDALRAHLGTGALRPEAARRAALIRLRDALEASEPDLLAALHADLGKPAVEAWASEIMLVRQELAVALRKLRGWMAPRRVGVRWFQLPGRASVVAEPRGVALILGPWNYPAQLCLMPLVSAVAAGCAVVLKPSELAPATADAIARLIERAFDPDHVRCVTGGPEVARALTVLPFDHVFFTGSTGIGRQVAEAAAKNLATVTLELGGVNPCIVDASADPAVTARRIAWGKFLNAGQTCLAPNHVWVEESSFDALTAALRDTLTRFYGPDGRGMQRIVNARQFTRLRDMLDAGRVLHGGMADEAALHIPPTILADADPALRREEIFGPILPVIPYRELDAVLAEIAAAPPPLAVYVHTRDRALADRVTAATRSGGVCVNDTLVQATVPELPFGGVGASGQGRYHGRAGFDAFSDQRAIFRQPAGVDPPMRYPPIKAPLSLLKRLMG